MTYNVAAFWPFWTTKELRRFDYVSDDLSIPHFTSVFSYDSGSKSMLYNNYDANGAWLNRWYYNYQPGFGVSEWRDDYPGGKKVVMSPAIGWGDNIAIGGTYINQPKFSFFQCWPFASCSGSQIVQFEQILPSMTVRSVDYPNVLVFSYLQAWNGKAATGARYWMAEGVGPIATQFITQAAPGSTVLTTTARMDATVSSVP